MAQEPLPTWLSIILGGVAASIPQIVSSVLQGRAAARQEHRRNEFAREQERDRNLRLIEQETRQAKRDRETNLWSLELDKFRSLEAFLRELILSSYSAENRSKDLLAFQEQFSMGFLHYDDAGNHLNEVLDLYLVIKATPIDSNTLPDPTKYLPVQL